MIFATLTRLIWGEFRPHRWHVVLMAMGWVFLTDVCSAQKTYASGTVTGGIINIKLLGTGPVAGITRSGGGISTVGTPGSHLLGVTDDNVNFYYAGDIKVDFGTPTSVGASTILGESEATPAVVRANKTLDAVVGLLGSNSYIQFRFGSYVSAGTPVLIKLKEKPQRTSTVDVALTGILGLASNNIIVGEVYTGALQPINFPGSVIPLRGSDVRQLTGTALGNASFPTRTRLLINKNGEWHAMVIPTATGTFNSVRLKVQFPDDLNVLSAANSIVVNVYNAFTEAAGGVCSVRPKFTSEGEATGVTLQPGVASDLLQLSQIVANPHRALDDDDSTYAAISSGILNVGLLSTISQVLYFDHAAGTSDGVSVKLGLNNSLVGLNLIQLNNIKFHAYNGTSETAVYSIGLGDIVSVLGLNLANLVKIGSNHGAMEVVFKPGVAFDRIKIEFNAGLLNLGLVQEALRVYDVSLAPGIPSVTSSPGNTSVCEGETALFSVVATGSISSYQWQRYNGTSWGGVTGSASTLTLSNTTTSMNNYLYRSIVTGGNATCLTSFTTGSGKLTVRSRPSIPPVLLQP